MGHLVVPFDHMPESCYDGCPMQSDHYCSIVHEITTEVIYEHRRLNNCPLKFIQNHGDLIDKDVIVSLDRTIYCGDCAVGIRSGILPHQVEMMKAVIPSDKQDSSFENHKNPSDSGA